MPWRSSSVRLAVHRSATPFTGIGTTSLCTYTNRAATMMLPPDMKVFFKINFLPGRHRKSIQVSYFTTGLCTDQVAIFVKKAIPLTSNRLSYGAMPRVIPTCFAHPRQ